MYVGTCHGVPVCDGRTRACAHGTWGADPHRQCDTEMATGEREAGAESPDGHGGRQGLYSS